MLLVNPWWGHSCPQNSIWSKFKYDPLGDIRNLDLVVSNQEIKYVSIYKSMLTLCHPGLGHFDHIGNFTYQISKLLGILFSGKNIF